MRSLRKLRKSRKGASAKLLPIRDSMTSSRPPRLTSYSWNVSSLELAPMLSTLSKKQVKCPIKSKFFKTVLTKQPRSTVRPNQRIKRRESRLISCGENAWCLSRHTRPLRRSLESRGLRYLEWLIKWPRPIRIGKGPFSRSKLCRTRPRRCSRCKLTPRWRRLA